MLGAITWAFYLSHQRMAAQMRLWEGLARAKNLTFTPAYWFFNTKSASVRGPYRNCNLALTLIDRTKGRNSYPYTQLYISGPGVVMPPPPADQFPLGHPLTTAEVETLLGSQPIHHQKNSARLEIHNRGQVFVYQEPGFVADTARLEALLDILFALTSGYALVGAPAGAA